MRFKIGDKIRAKENSKYESFRGIIVKVLKRNGFYYVEVERSGKLSAYINHFSLPFKANPDKQYYYFFEKEMPSFEKVYRWIEL